MSKKLTDAEKIAAFDRIKQRERDYTVRYNMRIKLERERYAKAVVDGLIPAVTDAEIDAELAKS